MEIDWRAEAAQTAYTVHDALSELLAMENDLEAVVIVAAVKGTAKRERWRNCLVVRRSMEWQYPAIGLLTDGLDSIIKRDSGSVSTLDNGE